MLSYKVASCISLTVPFHDLDPLNICWHGHYVRYFELARTALLQQINYDYPQMKRSGFFWPVIEIFVRYAHPLYYQQTIDIHARLQEWENRLKIGYEIRDTKTGKRLTRGHTLQVSVHMATQEMCFVTPEVFRKKLEPFLCTE